MHATTRNSRYSCVIIIHARVRLATISLAKITQRVHQREQQSTSLLVSSPYQSTPRRIILSRTQRVDCDAAERLRSRVAVVAELQRQEAPGDQLR